MWTGSQRCVFWDEAGETVCMVQEGAVSGIVGGDVSEVRQ